MGAMVGQELALRHPSLVRALVLANTTSGYPEAAREAWRQRIATVRAQGIEAIADAVMGRYFHDGFRSEHAATVARFRRRVVSTDVQGYIGCCNAVGTVDTTLRELSAIACMVCTTSPTTSPPRTATPEALCASRLARCALSTFCRPVWSSASMLAGVSCS
eukprot:gene4869-5786_t